MVLLNLFLKYAMLFISTINGIASQILFSSFMQLNMEN